MADLVVQALDLLQTAKVRLDAGLSDAEVSRVEEQFDFTFGPEHRQLLKSALPAGDSSWPDWRNGSAEDLQRRLDWPTDSVVYDVHNNDFWPSSWGERPDDRAERESANARAHLARVPRLVPLFAHRYLTVDPAYRPSPVFSVYQTDVIYYGDNLLDYVSHEFTFLRKHPSPNRAHVPFWSDLAIGAESRDL